MATAVHDKIKRSLQATEALYYRLVLVVGEAGSGKTGVLQDVATDLGTEVVNINLALAAELLALTGKQRSLRLPEILDRLVAKTRPPAVLDNLELLFDKALKQDPLRLLQGLSRNRSLVASWNGTFAGGKLLYAEPGHSEYRNYSSVDALVVTMDGASLADSATNG